MDRLICNIHGWLIIAAVFPGAFMAISYAGDDEIVIMGQTLKPGDVIEIRASGIPIVDSPKNHMFTHTALYLGKDPNTDKPSFFDFTTQAGKKKKFPENNYSGRILEARKFIDFYSSAGKNTAFDIYRLKDPKSISKKKLWQSAKRRAGKSYGFGLRWCSNQAASILQDSTGMDVIPGAWVDTPDSFHNKNFTRPTGGRYINFRAAQKENNSKTAAKKKSIITGTWEGIYYYQNGRASNKFNASFSLTGGKVSGVITEKVWDPRLKKNLNLRATVDGSLNDRQLHFTKTYVAGGWNHSVNYSGTVSTNGKSIRGKWNIENMSGSFNMSR